MTVDIARAMKDPEYRKSLTPEELASLPPNPAADPGLTATKLEGVTGGRPQSVAFRPERIVISS